MILSAMALISRLVGFLLVTIIGLFTPSAAYKHYVGGRDGWVWKPSEDYNHWAERNRFQVNDTVYFKGNDSVLVVTKDDYNFCNDKNPIQRLEMGDSTFTFDRSGPFFFISGNVDHCQKGQKLVMVVLAVRHKQRSHPPSLMSPATPLSSPSPEAPTPRALPPAPTSRQNPNGTNATAPPRNSSASSNFNLVLAVVSLIYFVWLSDYQEPDLSKYFSLHSSV